MEKIRVALYVQKAALQFIDAGGRVDHGLSEEAREAGFGIDPDELASIVRGHDIMGLKAMVDSKDLQGKFMFHLMKAFPLRMARGDLDKEKKKIFVQVTRDGYRQKISIYDLVVGDIVHLSIGDQVPADGVFISGYSLLIDESGMSGESEPSTYPKKKPFFLSGTKVTDGSGKMLVTTVGMRTEWGKLMETLTEGGDDETPLQVSRGKSTSQRVHRLVFKRITIGSDFEPCLCNEKLMKEKALVRHLSACETMGSASCICTDKTGTLTTNHMVVHKIWICGKAEEIKGSESADVLKSEISGRVSSILLQAIFQNTSSEVVKDKDGKNTILGTPTESALLEFGLLLGGNFDAQRKENKIVEVEPFNSVKKKMSVLVALPDGRIRAFCKGASEIILSMCNKILENPLLGFQDVDDPSNENDIPTYGYTLIMVVGIKDPTRPGVKDAVQTCLAAGIAVRMVTGPEFHSMSLEEMREIIPRIQVMARSLPSDKHTLVTHLRKLYGEVVAVTGDGTNDAPALHEADIGLAMGIAGTEGKMSGRFVSKNESMWKQVIVGKFGEERSNSKDSSVVGMWEQDEEEIDWPSQFQGMESSQLKFSTHFWCQGVQRLSHLGYYLEFMDLDESWFFCIGSNMGKDFDIGPFGKKRGLVFFSIRVAVSDAFFNLSDVVKLELGMGFRYEKGGRELSWLPCCVAKENADVIIMDDNFATIVNVAKWGRAVYINIQKFVQFQLTVNVVALVVNLFLRASQLLWVNLIMDTLGALALATEPPNDALMKRPPVGRSVSFITKTMWRNIIGQSIYQLIVIGVISVYGKRLLRLSGSDASDIIDTFIFNTFVFCQLFNEINSRDIEKINIFRGMFDSWIFIIVMVCTVAFQIIIVELLGTFASTVPQSWQLWILSILIGAVGMPVAVVLKCIPVETGSFKQHDDYEALPSGPEQA
ncbi:putative calcium-transporting ATPase 11, plasma membrane-type [Vitis vinifera]|uniref:P-type Ca(2+) transporter n=1 Tax=Vitis vinifera TaxID=29760 RepID=A0A438JKP1_VITVI|nr:putative calcium-transporting ATPase 11, plasma membrane-type [Vitis vinifera]